MKTGLTTSSLPSSLSITLSLSLSTDISVKGWKINNQGNKHDIMWGLMGHAQWQQYITITWEVTKSNIILFHEGLGTNQIREWSIHIKILKDKETQTHRSKPINVQIHYHMYLCSNSQTQAQEHTLGSRMASTLSVMSSSSESEFPALMSKCSKADSRTLRP